MTKNVHMCVTESLHCAAQGHNIVNQEGREGGKEGVTKRGHSPKGWLASNR